MVCHPNLVHQMLVNDRTFDKGGALIDRFREVLGNGLATCPHRDHQQQCRLLQPAFPRDRIPGQVKLMTEEIAGFMDRWHDDQVIDVLAEIHTIFSRGTSGTLFRTDVAAQATAAVVEFSMNSRAVSTGAGTCR